MIKTLLFFIIPAICIAQVNLKLIVINENAEPLNGALVTVSMKISPDKIEYIAFTDIDGFFEQSLLENSAYIISIKHLNYDSHILELVVHEVEQVITIILNKKTELLNEIVINHQKPKVKVKQDTVVFNVLKYIDNNDRKLKDIIDKLPGLVIENDGSIYFKGTLITRLLVENEPFFGGDTKLGLDNIPANVIDKLEIISNYSKSKLLKDTRRTQEQVINLVLKERKSAFVFGDIEASSNFDNFYNLRGSLFQFKPKQQNFIVGNLNNTGKQSLNNNTSNALSEVNSNLFKLTQIPINSIMNSEDYSEINSKLFTGNFKRIMSNSTWDFVVYINSIDNSKELSQNTEFLNNSSFENINEVNFQKDNNIYIRTTNYYEDSKKERIFASLASYKNSEINSDLLTNSNFGNRDFSENRENDYWTIGFILEETRKTHNEDLLVYGVELKSEKKQDDSLLSSNTLFLEEIIPWLEQRDFVHNYSGNLQTNNINLGFNFFKHLNNNYNKIYFSSKLLIEDSKSSNNQFQQLDNNDKIDFSEDFISEAKLLRAQLLAMAVYSYTKNKVDFNFQAELNSFYARFNNLNSNIENIKPILNIDTGITYHFNKKKQLRLNYKTHSALPQISMLDSFLKVVNRTSIIVGNPNLSNTKTNDLTINYFDYNIAKNYSFQSNQTLSINESAFGQSFEFNEINSISSYFLQNNSGYTFNSRNSFLYIFGNFETSLKLNYTFRLNRIEIFNLETSETERLNISTNIKTTFDYFANFSVNMLWGVNNQKFNNQTRNIISKGIQTKLNLNINSQTYAFIGYDYIDVDGSKGFDTLDFQIRYTNKQKSMDFALIGENTLGTTLNTTKFQTNLTHNTLINKALGKRILLSLNLFF